MSQQKRDHIQKQVLSAIRKRYIFAVTLIASFVTLTFFVNQTLDRRMEEDFKTINLSGRQRMLSQRIALLTMRKETGLQKEAVQKFEQGLDFLLKTRFIDPGYQDVYSLYKGPAGLEQESRKFLELAVSPDAFTLHQEEIFALSQNVLQKYEKVTFLKQHISESEFRNNLILEILLLLINFIILAFEIMFIFRPMVKNINDTFKELNEIEEKSFLSSRLALIGEIASGIGHEIKNPLFVLRYYAEKIDSPEISENIKKNADRISRILRSLSTQAREASKDALENVPITNIIDDAVEMLEPKIRYGNIELQKNLEFEGAINCRYAAISQVIANLLTNAIDAISEDNSEKKEIRIESGKDEKGVYLRIIDSGRGVSPEMSEKIFDSFMTTKKMGKGTGLGLPVSRRIMEEHNGTLALNPGISPSCFELRFPA